MARTRWTKETSVFSAELDAEHRELMRAADELRHTISAEKARALMSVLEDHFASEERLMKGLHYSAISWHKGQHDAIRKRAAGLPDLAAAGDSKAVLNFIAYLGDWLTGHIA